jgi:hypothetical protein
MILEESSRLLPSLRASHLAEQASTAAGSAVVIFYLRCFLSLFLSLIVFSGLPFLRSSACAIRPVTLRSPPFRFDIAPRPSSPRWPPWADLQ